MKIFAGFIFFPILPIKNSALYVNLRIGRKQELLTLILTAWVCEIVMEFIYCHKFPPKTKKARNRVTFDFEVRLADFCFPNGSAWPRDGSLEK